jgi:two-component system NtrC family sensor kinase
MPPGGVSQTIKVLEHAFEPFFTPKMSEGTGLGLAICQQIIEGHHGSIALDSVPGEGTLIFYKLIRLILE